MDPDQLEYSHDTGYKGRVAIHELLVVDDGLRAAIGRKAPIGTLRELSEQAGMVTLMRDGVDKALQGITDLRQVGAVCAR